MCDILHTYYLIQRLHMCMNSEKNITLKKEVQLSIYVSIQYFKYMHYTIQLYSNKWVCNCKTTLSSYLMVMWKHRVLRPKESEDEQ